MITKDNIEALVEFGGLVVYEVTWFNQLTWKPEIECRTFNESFAIERYNALKREEQLAAIDTFMVQFNYKDMK